MTHVSCRLPAENRDQLRNPTLGNRVWATFLPFLFTFAVAGGGRVYRTSVEYLRCLNDSLTTLCGTDAAAWQRAMTSRLVTSSLRHVIRHDCALDDQRSVPAVSSPAVWLRLVVSIV